jgi:steroid 5-alpha reductase family enzyme
MQQTISLYLLSLAIIFTYTKLLFFISHLRKNNSVADIAYGPAFIIATIALTIIQLNKTPLSLYTVVLFFLILIWGIRLSRRLYKRNHGKPEDFRHRMQREKWEQKGKMYTTVRTYIQIFVLQGFIISIVLLPFTLSLAASPKNNIWLFVGIIIWAIGFYFETIGDRELDTFIKTKPEHGTLIIRSGLWKYTRHPNHFGESVMWWAIAIIGIGASYSLLSLLSPILITTLILFVTGIPLIEKRFAGNPEWEEYKKRTSKFVPLPPKKSI